MKSIMLPDVPDKPNFFAIDPLDGRYFDAELAKYLSESSRIVTQAYVEAALAQTLAEFHICSQKIADEIEESARKVRAEAVHQEEKSTKHDIKALVNCIKGRVSDSAKPYVHFGATSYDIVATASVLQMRSVLDEVVVPRLKQLLKTLIGLAEKHASTVQIGRTHGQHAVPITFGFAISEYVSRLGQTIVALKELSKELKGKFSGAVGAYNSISLFVKDPLVFEQSVLKKLNLEPAEYSTQILPPEFMARIQDELTLASGVMANLSNDMRNLQRSEIAEVKERFESGQTGSSTMAHKKNPITFENVASLHKQVLAQSVNANLNLSSDHQRDLTDSASSRFYTLAPALVAIAAKRLDRAMAKIEVDEEAMQRNLKMSGGAIAAEPLYLLFEKYGHTAGHEKAKALAHQAEKQGKTLAEVVQADAEAAGYWQKFTPAERQIIKNPETHYTGQASAKAKDIAKTWRNRLAGK